MPEVERASEPAVNEASPPKHIGLIAGNGRFPLIFAQNAARLGYSVCAVAHIGETSPDLERYVARIHWIKIGQFNKLIRALKSDGVQETVMLGGIKKTHLFTTVLPDFRALAVARRLKHFKDDLILREVAAELEKEGIRVMESTFGLGNLVVEQGCLTARSPSSQEWEDIRYGWEVAHETGKLDIGQCVVIKDRVVVAVEAAEGTDEAIRRGGQLATAGAVVVKRCKPQQDLRFDLPAIGPVTIETMGAVKASALALEAGRGIVLDREETIALANKYGVTIIGMSA